MHKILLVEDDEIIRQQVKQLLEQWGYEVVAVEDFMDVLGIFVESDPHLILMDIGLPLYNGYHWCQEIRKVSKVPDHVSFFTGSSHGYCHGHQYGWRRLCHQAF